MRRREGKKKMKNPEDLIGKVIEEYSGWKYKITKAPYIEETSDGKYLVAEAFCEEDEEVYLLKWSLFWFSENNLYKECLRLDPDIINLKKQERAEYEIVGFDTLYDFVKALSEEFRQTRFDAVLPLINYSAYYYNVELSLEDENSHDKVSKLELKINYFMSWGANEPTTKQGELELFWTTGSNHTVAITGEWGEGSESWASFKVVLGDDLSRGFYPKVREILRKYASDGNDA
ncbi:hypothetical protein [Paenibacillus dendritiformis]|uniref:hypothetical protein n=1 Tax=Paenibacillus dendritiformis TaxID=130049 RepID=UPI000DA7BA5D|nr:hypothetical protein [Paenibacillus dendritiformis]PZM61774.1 hypothetical protein DOE73_30870 [Paenibacillus dendritiformis]